jgi:hypothetical protein
MSGDKDVRANHQTQQLREEHQPEYKSGHSKTENG